MEPSFLDLEHGSGSTRIWIGPRALADAEGELNAWLQGRRCFVISSAPVRRLHREALDGLLAGAVDVVDLEVPDGEQAKSLSVVERLCRELVIAGGKRDSRLLALGGGTIGDVGGFTAGCFLRGVEYAQFPTTLLAQVDAAIGGKTGVNLPESKNSVGAFHQPRWVVADSRFLRTLPAEELRQGMFEVVKAAIIGDRELFDLIESRLEAMLSGAAPVELADAVRRAVAVKVGVVAADEREQDLRRVLNLGHTLGHALETVLGHGRISHGDAVGRGLLFAVTLAESRGAVPEDAGRICSLIERLGPAAGAEADLARLLEALARDKKAREAGLSWVLPMAIGRVEILELSNASVKKQLASFLTGTVG